MSIKLFELSGQRALVTGSSQGIGLALATGLADAGSEPVLNGRDQAKPDASAAPLKAAGRMVRTLSFDATKVGAVRAAVEAYRMYPGAN